MRPTRAKTIEGLTERVRQDIERGEPKRRGRPPKLANAADALASVAPPVPPPKRKYTRGNHPASHTAVGERYKQNPNLIPNQHKFEKGNNLNPGGRPKNDIAAQIARAIFENNKEKLYTAYGKACLKGNAYAFQVLAERAYGKLKERHEYELTPYRDSSEESIHARIAEIESRLGYQGAPRALGGTEPTPQRTEPQILPPED